MISQQPTAGRVRARPRGRIAATPGGAPASSQPFWGAGSPSCPPVNRPLVERRGDAGCHGKRSPQRGQGWLWIHLQSVPFVTTSKLITLDLIRLGTLQP